MANTDPARPILVFTHFYENPRAAPDNRHVMLGRVPLVGEYVVLPSEQRHYRVTQVIHVGVEQGRSEHPFCAEVYCLQMTEEEVESMLHLASSAQG